MTDNPTPDTRGEAPASATVRCQVRGFDVLFTLRSDSGRDLLIKLPPLFERLEALGATPVGNGRGAPSEPGNEEDGDTKPCPVHPGSLLRKHSKDGKTWWSHKVEATGEWCRGKVPQGGGQ